MKTDSIPKPARVQVLGTTLQGVDYELLSQHCTRAARSHQVLAVEFANTHVVTLSRHRPDFRKLASAVDWFIPDGMPLIWCMNRAGAGLSDRVYGPTFFREYLTGCTHDLTHYLLGGTAECGARLRQRIEQWNPGLRILGSFHGLCRQDGTFADADPVEEINRLQPDFIWVGLGTPKQQAWIHANKARLQRGILLSVGFAFDVNAGIKPDAPAWMQRAGLTWLFRMASEPGRLLGRYLFFNSLFLAYLLRDGLRGRAWTRID